MLYSLKEIIQQMTRWKLRDVKFGFSLTVYTYVARICEVYVLVNDIKGLLV